MAGFDLGQPIQQLVVRLTRDTDFIAGITRTNDVDWPVGLVVKLVFNDDDTTTFTGTVVGPNITWSVDKAVVNPLITRAPTTARLFYIDGTEDILWAMGQPVIGG